VVQLAAHRTQACLYIAQALAVSQLSESHRQILVPAREASAVSIAAITSNTLLKLVGGQVVHELSKNGLAGIHPSLSVNGAGSAAAAPFPCAPEKVEIEKPNFAPIALIQKQFSRSEKV
jgi:hypothetical protein